MNINKFLVTAIILLSTSSLGAHPAPKEIVLAASAGTYLNDVVQEVGSRAFGKYNIEFGLRIYPKARALLAANSGDADGDAYRVFDLHKKTEGKFSNLITSRHALHVNSLDCFCRRQRY